ncbi:MAG: AidA/PixA family protein [Pseudomonadota bacterium]
MKFAKDDYVRMLSFSDKVIGNNGHWNIKIKVNQGDVIRWLDTTNTQGENHADMVIYDLKTPSNWNDYLDVLESKEFHSDRYFISNDNIDEPKFQCISGPNNYLITRVHTVPNQSLELQYFLKVALIKNHQVIGTYGIDPSIKIEP